tara:strand:- start:37 stop:1251 length:1215 start_codon:yes stop_codon:yes gene_type:complete
MRKKVIWILNQTAGKPDSGWGERHFNFSKHWISKGYKVKIISGSYNHLFINQPKITNSAFTLEEVEENITFCWVKIPKYDGGSIFKLWSMIVFAFKVLFLKSSQLEKPDIIIVSSMPIFPILSGIYLKRKFKAKKLVVEIRDLWPLTPMFLLGYSKFHPMILLMAWIEKIGYKKSDSIVSLLPNASSYINKISGDASKFTWISNGIDENLLANEPLSKSIIDQIPTNKFIVGYAGTMGLANALEYLIEASILMVNNVEVHFVLIGNGYLKESLIQKTAGNLNITFIDKINKAQVQNMLHYFDVCFIGRNDTPLFNYGVSSNKYFDYMLASKPILESSNFIKSPVEMSNCGITVLPESGKSIVDGILEFQNMSSEELKGIGEKGLIYVRKYHNFEYLSDKYLNLF